MKPQTNGTTGPPGVNDNGSEFPGKASHCKHVFYRYSVEEKETKTGKVAKEQSAAKQVKPATVP